MSNIMQDLHTVGINPFAVTLLAESVLKSPLAPMTIGKPMHIPFTVNRSDCVGWAGVRITVEAVPEADRNKPWAAVDAAELRRLHGERATLADWIEEALSVLETDAEGDDARRLLIEQGNRLVVAVRGGER